MSPEHQNQSVKITTSGFSWSILQQKRTYLGIVLLLLDYLRKALVHLCLLTKAQPHTGTTSVLSHASHTMIWSHCSLLF